jgi:2-iminobutanoate/2-iminopropanoate deaminase
MRHSTLAALALVALASSASAQRTTVTAPGMNVTATLSPAIKVGDMLYLSGQLASKPGTREPMDSTIEGQTKQALENIKTLVEAAGGTMNNVAKCTVFLVKLEDFRGMNSAYSSFWPKDPPARSTVVVAALVSPAAKLEVECIASLAK